MILATGRSALVTASFTINGRHGHGPKAPMTGAFVPLVFIHLAPLKNLVLHLLTSAYFDREPPGDVAVGRGVSTHQFRDQPASRSEAG